MARIKVLDEQLANQIAAGEVVERPVSVVKELVENAVDAGGSAVDVTIEEGGLTLIRVVDNGGGIEADDLATAFQRHATSKISASGDLFRIASLGFRGEALPSIAAVSRLSCVSADSNSGLARRLDIEGGSIAADEPANAPQGTDMTVRDLFYNMPARLKYMKSIQTELGHISDYMNRIALAHPGIAFTLKHNGSVLLRTLGTGDRQQVIAAIYGTSAAKAMLPIAASDADYELMGYISKPELTRANRNGITVIVNGRYIRSHAVNQALMQAYHTYLPINRFPLAVLEIGMHPSLLDVNVHPSKMEVRFSKEAELRTLIERAARAVVSAERYIPGPDAGNRQTRSKPQYVQDAISFHVADRLSASHAGSGEAPAAPQRSNPPGDKPYASRSEYVPKQAAEQLYAPPQSAGRDAAAYGSGRTRDAWEVREGKSAETGQWSHGNEGSLAQTRYGAEQSAAASDAAFADAPPSAREAGAGESTLPAAGPIGAADPFVPGAPSLERGGAHDAPPSERADARNGVRDNPPSERDEDFADAAKPGFPELHWIGQHHGTYIVAQSEDGLYLIDQHAAHERINYEYYLHKFGNPVAASQQLLVPLTLEFTPGEAVQLRELTNLFGEAGVEIEPFGAQTFLVRAYPEWMPAGEEQALLEEMAELLINERKSINIAKLREKAAIMCACKASIKANDRMTREDGDALLARLASCEQPYTCPHGRPIIVHLSTYQLEKMFKRVMS